MRNAVLMLGLMFVCVGSFAQKPDSAKNLNKTKNIDGTMMSPANDIYTNVLAAPQFSILVKLVNAADFANRLKTSPLTFLAPTNKAFAKNSASLARLNFITIAQDFADLFIE